MYRKQRGVTAIGWVFLLIPMAIVIYSVIRLVPVYLTYAKVARSMEQLSQESRAGDSAQNVRFALEKRLDIEGVTFPDGKDFTIRRDGPAWVVEIEYEDGAPLLSNVEVTATFNKSVRLGEASE
jgi:hypothetical protein